MESDDEERTAEAVQPVKKAPVSKKDTRTKSGKSVTFKPDTKPAAPARPTYEGDLETLLAEMASGEKTWGDLMFGPTMDLTDIPLSLPTDTRANKWMDFWTLPFADKLRELWGDVYDCSTLSDPEWNEMMRWLFDAGWDVTSYDRNGVEFEADNGPRRVWISPAEMEEMLAEEASLRRRAHSHHHHHHHRKEATKTVVSAERTLSAPDSRSIVSAEESAAQSDGRPARSGPPRKKSTTVPRFCRVGKSCSEEGCRYVHADTIQRVNRPCGFGADCGKGDATKRAACLYMHPGETWSESLVVHRPVTAAAE